LNLVVVLVVEVAGAFSLSFLSFLFYRFIFVNTIESLHLTFSEEFLHFLLRLISRDTSLLFFYTLVLLTGAIGPSTVVDEILAQIHVCGVRVHLDFLNLLLFPGFLLLFVFSLSRSLLVLVFSVAFLPLFLNFLPQGLTLQILSL
jgi:hypothetical protein